MHVLHGSWLIANDTSKDKGFAVWSEVNETSEERYFDLFDPDCPTLPDLAQLPLVLIDGKVLSSGGKISVPAIRKQIEGLGVGRDDH